MIPRTMVTLRDGRRWSVPYIYMAGRGNGRRTDDLFAFAGAVGYSE